MDELLINAKSRRELDKYLANPPHAVLLGGQVGVGLGTLARKLAKKQSRANIYFLSPDEKHKISVENIRALYDVTRGKQTEKFSIVIDDAEAMTMSAQNAFLKLLEEPSTNIFFILTSHQSSRLLPTVISRLQQIQVMPTNNSGEILKDLKIPQNKRAQIEFIANGRPAEIKRLLESDEYFRDQARKNETAKQFLSASTYERLKIISTMKKRQEAMDFVTALANLVTFTMARRVNDRLINDVAIISEVTDRLAQNGNVRAQMTYLAVAMV